MFTRACVDFAVKHSSYIQKMSQPPKIVRVNDVSNAWTLVAIAGSILLLYTLSRIISLQRRVRDLEARPPVDDIVMRGMVRQQVSEVLANYERRKALESKPEPVIEFKADVKADSKPEAKLEAKLEAKQEPKVDDTQIQAEKPKEEFVDAKEFVAVDVDVPKKPKRKTRELAKPETAI